MNVMEVLNYHRTNETMFKRNREDCTTRHDLKYRGECKCMFQKEGRVVFTFFLGNSYHIKNMVKILGPQEEEKYFFPNYLTLIKLVEIRGACRCIRNKSG